MSNCIEWPKATNKRTGHGVQWFGGKTEQAHRVAYIKHHGLSIEDIAGVVIRHTCDNPPCINPEHLVEGTVQDNVNDRVARGRSSRHRAILTEKQKQEIRKLCVPGHREFGQSALAARYGVTQQTLSRVLKEEP